MKRIWRLSCRISEEESERRRYYLFLRALICGAVGFALWVVLHFAMKLGWSWAVICVGFPAYFVGFIGGVIHLWHQKIEEEE